MMKTNNDIRLMLKVAKKRLKENRHKLYPTRGYDIGFISALEWVLE